MRAILLSCVLIILLNAIVEAAEMKENPSTGNVEGSFTIENPVFAKLKTCRDQAKGTLEMVKCYEEGISFNPKNLSMMSSLSLLYLRADLLEKAKLAMNRTVSLWIESVNSVIQDDPRAKAGNMSYVDVLRHMYDVGRNNSMNETMATTTEVAMVLAKKFELEHKPTDAHAIYYQFLIQVGAAEENLMDFHRRTGNVMAMVLWGNQSTTSIGFRLAEAILPIVDGFPQHLFSFGSEGPVIRRMCGIEFDEADRDEILVRDIIKHIQTCVERFGWEDFKKGLEEAGEEALVAPFGPTRATSLHRLSTFGVTEAVRHCLDYLDGTVVPADRFGRGLLHYAAAGGWESTSKLLVAKGSRWDKEDRGRIQPVHLGCSSPNFKDVVEESAGKSSCVGITRRKLEDEDIPVTDDSGTDGGWNTGRERPRYLHCDIDQRDGGRLTQHDIMVGYMLSNMPVMVKNGFYDLEDGAPDDLFHRKLFNKTFGKVLIRKEATPAGERWGVGPAEIVSVRDFLATADQNDGTVGSVVVQTENHPFHKLATEWTPASLKTKKNFEEPQYFNLDVSVPQLHLMKKGSKKMHSAHGYMSYHAVVYGHAEFTLLPPRDARTSRHGLSEKMKHFALRCEATAGDILVLPELWSMDWKSKSNGVMIERNFFRDEV